MIQRVPAFVVCFRLFASCILFGGVCDHGALLGDVLGVDYCTAVSVIPIEFRSLAAFQFHCHEFRQGWVLLFTVVVRPRS